MATYQFNIVFGILVAFVSNYLISILIENNSWRWMIGIEAVPAFIYTIMVFMVPKSPRWLIIKNRTEEAKKIIKLINPDSNPDEVVAKILALDKSKPKESVFQRKYKRKLL